MTCSRLFILGALLTVASPVTAQPAAPAKPAKAAKAAKAKAKADPGAGQAAAPPAAAASAPAGAAAAAAPAAAKGQKAAKGAKGAAPAVAAKVAAPVAPAAALPAKYPAGLVEPKVRIVRNQVEIAGTDRRAAKKDDSILPGQKVSTQAQSSAEVAYADGTRVIVGENSELSLYGVAPPPPAGKKPKAFKPGTTTLLHGDVLIIVPAPVVAAAPPPVAAAPGKKVKAPKKAPAPKPALTATVATPSGKVIVAPGSEVRISVEPTGITRVAVYSGSAQLAGKGKPILLAAGVGGRIESAKTAPKAGTPLPAAPVIANVQQLSFSSGEPVEVRGTYGLAATSAPAATWHVQVSRDSSFDTLVSDVRVAGTETRLLPQKVEPGDYYVRVSAVDASGAEGPASIPTRVRVAKVSILPGGEGKRAAVAVEGKDLHCALDGAPLSPMLEPLPLSPARDHLVRCATVPSNAAPEQIVEKRITALQSGPLVSRIEPGAVTFTPADPKAQTAATAQRPVTLVLADASGAPISGAQVRVEATGGAQVSGVRESQTPGSYVATVTWPAGQTGQTLRYTINDVESYEGRLPDALPPAPAEPGKGEEPSDKQLPKRFAFELGLLPTAGIDTTRYTFDIGAGLDIGGRVRLPYGALAFSLRPQYEYHPASPGVAHVVAVGLPITYRIRRNVDEGVVPYIGVLPQFLALNSYLTRDGVQIVDPTSVGWHTAFGIGGLVGTEFRVKHGAVFAEAGYRYAIHFGDPVPDYIPTLNTLFANIGFRLSF